MQENEEKLKNLSKNLQKGKKCGHICKKIKKVVKKFAKGQKFDIYLQKKQCSFRRMSSDIGHASRGPQVNHK